MECQVAKETTEKQAELLLALQQEEKVCSLTQPTSYHHDLLPENDITNKFNEFIDSCCFVHHELEERSVNLEGRYRLWSHVKPSKDIFHALKHYLDTRFKQKRIQTNHGYLGLQLKPLEYKKRFPNTSTVENFLFQVCLFSDTGKIIHSVLLQEYRKWKLSLGMEISDFDLANLKDYLDASPYTLKATVWTNYGNNEGYYGISLKADEYKTQKINSSSGNHVPRGKSVEKRLCENDIVVGRWDSIAKAAEAEHMSTAKMSRYVRDKKTGTHYYCFEKIIV